MQEKQNSIPTNALADSLKEYIAFLRSRIKAFDQENSYDTIIKIVYTNVIFDLEYALLRNGIPIVENERREYNKKLLAEAQAREN